MSAGRGPCRPGRGGALTSVGLLPAAGAVSLLSLVEEKEGGRRRGCLLAVLDHRTAHTHKHSGQDPDPDSGPGPNGSILMQA